MAPEAFQAVVTEDRLDSHAEVSPAGRPGAIIRGGSSCTDLTLALSWAASLSASPAAFWSTSNRGEGGVALADCSAGVMEGVS